eukprot:TRINITY_DN1615_c0_g1_i1.p2 TRINITY_DN1615_c0_g1~~TRINITY_DN1615_c0_g1_i1.p2  ORF type:complete len:101 (+),score=7.98 TRINITY_DN1615_c0_g1_i1:67-369(+)
MKPRKAKKMEAFDDLVNKFRSLSFNEVEIEARITRVVLPSAARPTGRINLEGHTRVFWFHQPDANLLPNLRPGALIRVCEIHLTEEDTILSCLGSKNCVP